MMKGVQLKSRQSHLPRKLHGKDVASSPNIRDAPPRVDVHSHGQLRAPCGVRDSAGCGNSRDRAVTNRTGKSAVVYTQGLRILLWKRVRPK